MKIETKIEQIKQIIDDHHDDDGDFWSFVGDKYIREILDSFDTPDWECFIIELANFDDKQRLQFCKTALHYSPRNVDIIDVLDIFFNQYLLLNLEDADWMIEGIVYLQNMRSPSLDLLEKLRQKIDQIRRYEKKISSEKELLSAEDVIDKVVKTHYR